LKRLISLFLFVASLALATIACRSSPTPTEAPTEAPTDQPTEVVTEVLTATPAEEATPSLGDTWTRPADGMVMVYVPAGEFEMGSTGGDDDEQPVHTVALDGFWIDRTEVTKAQYEQCMAAGATRPSTSPGTRRRPTAGGPGGDCQRRPSGSMPRGGQRHGCSRGGTSSTGRG
jgi:formylglycine-generating enzyme required for sulfatase activity